MNPLLQALMGGYQPGEMHALMQAGLANHPEHEIDPMILAQAQQDVLGGGQGAPHGYVDSGPITGQLNREAPEGMAYSRHAPWQPPLNTGMGMQAPEEPFEMPQVDVVPGYSRRGQYPEPGDRAAWLDDGRQVSPSDFSRFAGKGDVMDRQQQGMNPGGQTPSRAGFLTGQGADIEQGPGGGLAQALAGGLPQSEGYNRYLPGMPSEAERNQNVMLNARARKESRLARMGEVSPTMLGMFDQAMDSGQGGGMSPMMAGMFGGPQGFNVALQNQGLMDRTQMAMGPQEAEAQARLMAAQTDAEFKRYLMSPDGQRFALQREGVNMPAQVGSREWMIKLADRAPDYATFESIVASTAPEAAPMARQIWMETKLQDPTAPQPPGILGGLYDSFKDGLPFN